MKKTILTIAVMAGSFTVMAQTELILHRRSPDGHTNRTRHHPQRQLQRREHLRTSHQTCSSDHTLRQVRQAIHLRLRPDVIHDYASESGAQAEQRIITLKEIIACRTDVGPGTALLLAIPQNGMLRGDARNESVEQSVDSTEG